MNANTTAGPKWSEDNPFAARIRDRLRRAGGQHRSPGTQTDSRIQREELTCSMLREAHQLTEGPEPSPF